MFLPPPEENKEQISEKPMPALPPVGSAPVEETHQLASDAPQGDDLFYYVFDCLNRGSSKAEVRKQLIAFGYSAAAADETVVAVADYRRKNPDHTSIAKPAAPVGGGNSNMWIGGVICLIGIVVTVGSCLLAGEGGGRYYIAWGAIVWGGIQFFRGLSQSNQN